jgi:DNA-directed RNA polymerase subunit RPC12/RpoP
MSAYTTLYRCNTCHSTIDMEQDHIEKATCRCGLITFEKGTDGGVYARIYVKRKVVQLDHSGPSNRAHLL